MSKSERVVGSATKPLLSAAITTGLPKAAQALDLADGAGRLDETSNFKANSSCQVNATHCLISGSQSTSLQLPVLGDFPREEPAVHGRQDACQRATWTSIVGEVFSHLANLHSNLTASRHNRPSGSVDPGSVFAPQQPSPCVISFRVRRPALACTAVMLKFCNSECGSP